jgi:hypothetical protein
MLLSLCAAADAFLPGIDRDEAAEAAAAERMIAPEELLEYAKRPADRSLWLYGRVPLGKLHGMTVVAEYFCSDNCPALTMRVIHLPVDLDGCVQAGGVVKKIAVPYGLGTRQREFCIPKVLADELPK